MIAYVDKSPMIEPHNGGFLVTFKSGDTETAFMLTLHAMTALCGPGMAKVKEAQASCVPPIPFKAGKG